MSKYVEKANLLFDRRPELAAKELLAALAETPDDAYLHAYLSLCLMNANDQSGAMKAAKDAISLDPEESLGFYALAKCHYDKLNFLESEVAIDEAIRIDSWNPTYWGLLANIEIENLNWKEALVAAETGLEMDPGDVHCHNLRAFIQAKLGKKHEAKASADTALAADPENALTHAYSGWTLIEHHQHEESIKHFREALRLDPTLEWARQGLIKALEVRHWAFQFHLKLQQRSAVAILSVITVFFLGLLAFTQNATGAQAQLYNTAKLACAALIVFYIFFRLLPVSWLSQPFMRFLLMFDQDGRLAMTREERAFNTHLVGFMVLMLLGCALAGMTSTWWILSVIIFLYFVTEPLTKDAENRNKAHWITMVSIAFVFGGLALFATTNRAGWYGLRTIGMFAAFKSMATAGAFKGLLSAGALKGILGAIGLGATATALKAKEKEKVREQMLSSKTTDKSR